MSDVERTSNAHWTLTPKGGGEFVVHKDAQAESSGLLQDALELRVDGELFALCEPSNDLRRRHTTIDLPAECFDGATHVIEAIEQSSGQHAVGSPRHFRDESVVRAAIQELDGTAVVGWVESPDNGPIDLTLLIDNKPVARQYVARSSDRRRTFRLPVPKDWLDGLPHMLSVKVTDTGKVLGHLAEALPSIATPWPALQRHGGPTLPAAYSPAASRRYENLLLWLQESAELPGTRREDDPFTQLAHVHKILVHGWEAVRDFAPLSFPQFEQPVVSVIVPVHNNAALTYTCLAALSFAYNQVPFDVIVVDDGSSDETAKLSEVVDGVTFVRNETAQGFVRACNLGARHARGTYFVFLNNDTEPTAAWLDELLFAFDAFPDVGLAGSKLLFQDGRLQDAGGIVWNTGNPWNYGRGGNPEDPRFNYTRQVDYISGAALMVSRDVWEAVSGFSEAYCPAYFEDTDLAFKVQAIGKQVVYVPLSVVYHFDGMSRGAGTEHDVKQYQEINRPTFKRRWIYAYQSNGDEGRNVDLVKDRNVSYRALVIDHHVPQPDRDAGSYAAIQEIRLLQALGCKITFLPLNFAHLGSYTQELQRLGVECLHAPYFSSVRDVLTQRGAEFDLVYITRYTAARRVLKEIRQLAPQAKVLFCNADLHFLRTLRVALAESDRAALEMAKWIRDEELKVMRQADVVLSYNEVEHAVILSHNLDRSKVVLAPWVVDVQDEVPPFDARSDVAFLGGFGHPPNLPAAQFFIREVMPLLRQRLPGVRFRVFGSNVPEELRALHSEDVLIEGYVEDLAQVYDACRVFVAPLLTGAGLKGKVVDALARGTPSVLSPIAAEGIGIRHGLEALIATTPEEWVAAIADLYEDPERWQATSNQARAFARESYSFERGRQLMAKALAAAGIAVPTAPRALVATSTRVVRHRGSSRIEASRFEETRAAKQPSIVSPEFCPVASHLLTEPLPPMDDLVLVPDSDVGPILTDPRDKEIGGWLRDKRTWSPAEGRFLMNILQPGMNAIDVGANIGYFTLLCARAVGPSGRVLAVEADPETFLQLRANIALDTLENVELLPLAAHRQAGMVEIWRNPDNYGGHSGYPVNPDATSSSMQAARLDEVLQPETPIDVIKIDIEGMDHAAVQGLEATIRRWRPTLLVEYNPLAIELFGEDPVAVLGYYRSLGLQVRVLGTDARRLRDYAGMNLDEFVSRDLVITEDLDARIAELTHPIGLINLVLTPHGRSATVTAR